MMSDQILSTTGTPTKEATFIPGPVMSHALTPCPPAGKRKVHIQLQSSRIKNNLNKKIKFNKRNEFKAIRKKSTFLGIVRLI